MFCPKTNSSRQPPPPFPLPSELDRNETVKARFWPWLEPLSVRKFHVRCSLHTAVGCTGQATAVPEPAPNVPLLCLCKVWHLGFRLWLRCLDPDAGGARLAPELNVPLLCQGLAFGMECGLSLRVQGIELRVWRKCSIGAGTTLLTL